MNVRKQVLGIVHDYGGREPSGWLPPGAATPLPTPLRRVTLDLTIEGDPVEGYLLFIVAREDDEFCYDHWFQELAQAEKTAEESYGVRLDRWQDS